MAQETFIEWVQRRNNERRRENERAVALDRSAWQRNAVLAQETHRAVHMAATRVISAVAQMFGGDGKIDFDYDLLPTWKSFMPLYGDESDQEDEAEADDHRPLDPETMSMDDWANMMADVRQWQRWQTGTGEYSRT